MDLSVKLALTVPKAPLMALKASGAFTSCTKYLDTPYSSLESGVYFLAESFRLYPADNYPDMTVFYALNNSVTGDITFKKYTPGTSVALSADSVLWIFGYWNGQFSPIKVYDYVVGSYQDKGGFYGAITPYYGSESYSDTGYLTEHKDFNDTGNFYSAFAPYSGTDEYGGFQ